ncbi:GNAT family N-acetyltransferase [Pseudalkalibacillus decolorationis]|uniref:GNAT family N-acetyltransferase n=1 Tax=Pseudalkalibacillus decolorationis TaxID=163879 RepID=UPI00214945C4|nr:GNAT family N-acetyltransferase [Pseudalkalibacillus decolorationis]
MEIRQLQSSDAVQYWELRVEALKQNPEAFATSYEDALQRENPLEQVANNLNTTINYTFGAFENNQLIGVVTLLEQEPSKLRHTANIFAMYSTPSKRGKGVGKALLVKAINQAKNIDYIEKLKLTVVTENVAAKGLYTSLGFKSFGIEEKALKVNDKYYDEEYMTLFL